MVCAAVECGYRECVNYGPQRGVKISRELAQAL